MTPSEASQSGETVPIDESEAALETVIEEGEFVSVVRASGEVDLNTIPLLKNALADASEAEDGVILDMRGVKYMDSSGFAALLDAGRILRSTGASLHLFGCAPSIARMMEITRLNMVLSIHQTEDEAREAVESAASNIAAAVVG